MDLYRKAEDFLEPAQGVVILSLWAIIGVSLFMIFQPSASARTAWAAYMWSP